MSTNSRATCVALPVAVAVAKDSEGLSTKSERRTPPVKQNTKQTTIAQPAKPSTVPQKRRSPTRTNAFRDLRVMQEYAAGKTQTQIAREPNHRTRPTTT